MTSIKRDHEFWSKYSERFIGNWITYDTSVQQIADWVEKVYLRNDYSGFTGDRKFVRDDDAQKAFSKLRSSQAGMYAWRLQLLQCPCPHPIRRSTAAVRMPYRPKSDAEVQQLYKECDFAFKQSFAFCPYSPEAVVRYANFLFQFQRFDDALIVAKTCQKLDPYNGQITGLIDQIEDIKKRMPRSRQQRPGNHPVATNGNRGARASRPTSKTCSCSAAPTCKCSETNERHRPVRSGAHQSVAFLSATPPPSPSFTAKWAATI